MLKTFENLVPFSVPLLVLDIGLSVVNINVFQAVSSWTSTSLASYFQYSIKTKRLWKKKHRYSDGYIFTKE